MRSRNVWLKKKVRVKKICSCSHGVLDSRVDHVLMKGLGWGHVEEKEVQGTKILANLIPSSWENVNMNRRPSRRM